MVNLSDTAISAIRTGVPMGVGILAAAITNGLGVEVPAVAAESLSYGVIAFASLAYYGAARKLEQKFPKWGWLLGVPKAPVYDLPPAETESRSVLDPDGTLREIHSVTRWPRPDAK